MGAFLLQTAVPEEPTPAFGHPSKEGNEAKIPSWEGWPKAGVGHSLIIAFQCLNHMQQKQTPVALLMPKYPRYIGKRL